MGKEDRLGKSSMKSKSSESVAGSERSERGSGSQGQPKKVPQKQSRANNQEKHPQRPRGKRREGTK